MELKIYLLCHKTSITQFAKMVGISRSYLNQIILGKKFPSQKLAKRIEEASEGHVTVKDVMKKVKKDVIIIPIKNE